MMKLTLTPPVRSLHRWIAFAILLPAAAGLGGCAAQSFRTETVGYSKNGTPITRQVVNGVAQPRWGLYRQVDDNYIAPRTDLPITE